MSVTRRLIHGDDLPCTSAGCTGLVMIEQETRYNERSGFIARYRFVCEFGGEGHVLDGWRWRDEVPEALRRRLSAAPRDS